MELRAGSKRDAPLRFPVPDSPFPRSSADDREQVVLAHHEVFGTVDLDLGARVLAEQDGVARLDLELAHLTVVERLAFAHGDDFTANRLLGGAVGDHDAAGGNLLFFQALDDHAVVERGEFHDILS